MEALTAYFGMVYTILGIVLSIVIAILVADALYNVLKKMISFVWEAVHKKSYDSFVKRYRKVKENGSIINRNNDDNDFSSDNGNSEDVDSRNI